MRKLRKLCWTKMRDGSMEKRLMELQSKFWIRSVLRVFYRKDMISECPKYAAMIQNYRFAKTFVRSIMIATMLLSLMTFWQNMMRYKRKREVNTLSFSYDSGTILIKFLLLFFAQKAKKTCCNMPFSEHRVTNKIRGVKDSILCVLRLSI